SSPAAGTASGRTVPRDTRRRRQQDQLPRAAGPPAPVQPSESCAALLGDDDALQQVLGMRSVGSARDHGRDARGECSAEMRAYRPGQREPTVEELTDRREVVVVEGGD